MEQSRKYLKLSSIAVLALSFFSMLQLVSELLFGDINQALIPEGAPDNILLITRIILFAVAFLLMLPNVYIGIKGMGIAKKPNASKAHIVWAIILLAFACLSIIEPVVTCVSDGMQYENISAVLSIAVEITVFFEYIKYAMAVRNNVV